MAHRIVMDAAEATLAAAWVPAHPTIPIVPQNPEDGGVPPDAPSWLKIDYPVTRAEQISIGAPGNNVWREDGVFRVLMFLPLGGGTLEAREWASEVEAIFRGKIIAPHVTTWAPSTNTDDGDNEAGRFIVAVAVPYTADIFG